MMINFSGVVRAFLAGALSLWVAGVHATAQIPDELLYEGEQVSLFANPILPLLKKAENFKKVKPFFKGGCSASWIGFKANWKI